MPHRRAALAVALSVAVVTACSSVPSDDGGDGSSGTSGVGGSAQGGAQPSGGSGGLAGTSAGAVSVSGASGAAGVGTSGTGGSGAPTTGGTTSGGAGGDGGTDAGGAGALGGAGMGGTSGGAEPGGTGSGGLAGDRCDIAVYNAATPPRIVAVSGSTDTHDPSVVEVGSALYLFHTGTGMGLGAKTSTAGIVNNAVNWANGSNPFTSNPSWIAALVPGVSNLWAPDISFFGGQYHLYYSASTSGENQSCIGHATRAALGTGSWTDHGRLICSNVGTNDDWNAIDPNLVLDQTGAPYLSFGSFWSGIKMIPLDMTGARMGAAAPLAIANRPNNAGALEAPFIVRRCGYYYLFTSWDRCCQGVDSTYNIRVTRGASVTGPYTDKAGTAAAQGGGTLLVQGDTRWKGPGHNAVLFVGGAAYNVYHSYDANNAGRVTLRISELAWDADAWPISAGP